MSPAVVPPRYSAESVQSVPSYSSEPSSGEQRLELTPRVARRPTPNGTFTREKGRVSVLLTEQEDGIALPTYSRNDSVRGVVFLKDTEGVAAVAVKVLGVQNQYFRKNTLLIS